MLTTPSTRVQGFYEVIPHNLVCVFNYQELELLLCGLPRIDAKDWQANTRYSGGYNKDHEVVQWFFEVLGSWTDDRKARLLQFATGSSHVPVEGFRAMQVRACVCVFICVFYSEEVTTAIVFKVFSGVCVGVTPRYDLLRQGDAIDIVHALVLS